jgi:1-acyl-sn-glycerol-3-phosphate acyltransferase
MPRTALKPQVYIDPRPPEYFQKFHDRVRAGRPDWVYKMVRLVLTGPLLVIYRLRAIGPDNVPLQGPAIVTPNHFSFMDHFLVAALMRREVNFMAKSQLFGVHPVLTFIYTHGGVFPVMRGKRDDEAFKTAHAVLARGGIVLMYGEGGRSRSKRLGEPKPGVGRLALESGVPVVPFAIHGSEDVREFRRLRFPKVTVQYGEPISFPVVEHPTREQSQETSEKVFGRVRSMHEALDAEGRAGVLARRKRERRAGVPATG